MTWRGRAGNGLKDMAKKPAKIDYAEAKSQTKTEFNCLSEKYPDVNNFGTIYPCNGCHDHTKTVGRPTSVKAAK